MSIIGDLVSIGFIIVLTAMISTFGVALMDTSRRKTFGIVAGILTGVAVGFMVAFIIGGIFFPEPTV